MYLSYGEERGGVRLRLALRFSADAEARVIVVAAVAIFVGFWLDRSLTSWRELRTHAYDLAVFDQLIWNTAHGRLFETSFAPYNYLGDHFQPVLVLFVPVYWFGGGARALRLHPVLAASAATAYLLNPYLHRRSPSTSTRRRCSRFPLSPPSGRSPPGVHTSAWRLRSRSYCSRRTPSSSRWRWPDARQRSAGGGQPSLSHRSHCSRQCSSSDG